MNLSTIHTDDLGQMIDEAMGELPIPLRFYAYLRVHGTLPSFAATSAGFEPPMDLEKMERKTADFRALYLERVERSDGMDVGWTRARLRQLWESFIAKGDEGAALAVLKEIAKVGGHYPQEPRAAAGSGPVLVQVNLQLPERLVRPSFLPALPAVRVDPLT
jgi:hypothetical protein